MADDPKNETHWYDGILNGVGGVLGGPAGRAAAEKLDPTIKEGMREIGKQVAAAVLAGLTPENMKAAGEGIGRGAAGEILSNPQKAGEVAQAVTAGVMKGGMSVVAGALPDIFANLPEMVMNVLSGPNSPLGAGRLSPDAAAGVVSEGYENIVQQRKWDPVGEVFAKDPMEGIKDMIGSLIPQGVINEEDRLAVIDAAAKGAEATLNRDLPGMVATGLEFGAQLGGAVLGAAPGFGNRK